MKIKVDRIDLGLDLNGPRSRHRHKYSKYQKCLRIMMDIYIEQHLSNI